jgi:Family of unknown function (DUF5908)
MPLRVNEFVIQAKFEDEENVLAPASNISEEDLNILKEEIINECIEKIEAMLRKKEGR